MPVPKMGRSAYWKGDPDSLASFALGDANRGAFLALHSAVSTRRRLVATDPPERRASSLSCAGTCGSGTSETPFKSGGERLFPIVRRAVASPSPVALLRLPLSRLRLA